MHINCIPAVCAAWITREGVPWLSCDSHECAWITPLKSPYPIRSIGDTASVAAPTGPTAGFVGVGIPSTGPSVFGAEPHAAVVPLQIISAAHTITRIIFFMAKFPPVVFLTIISSAPTVNATRIPSPLAIRPPEE